MRMSLDLSTLIHPRKDCDIQAGYIYKLPAHHIYDRVLHFTTCIDLACSISLSLQFVMYLSNLYFMVYFASPMIVASFYLLDIESK